MLMNKNFAVAGVTDMRFSWGDDGTCQFADGYPADQKALVEGVLANYDPLPSAKKEACAAIDAKAEALRQMVLTPGAGQMAAYQAKEAQAKALLQDPNPTEGEYPDIFNEIGITAGSAAAVAQAVLVAAEKWREFGRKIEHARLGGKMAVNAAVDVAGVDVARDGIFWPAS